MQEQRHWGPGSPDMMVSPDVLPSRWYVRANMTVEQAREACGEIQPLARGGAPEEETAFLTGEMTAPALQEKLAGVDVSSCFRVL